MKRLLPFTQEHEMFREAFCKFLDNEVTPHYDEYEQNHMVSRDVYKKMGELGYIAMWMDEKYGGVSGDLLYTIIQTEEMNLRGLNGIFTRLNGDIIAPYIYNHGTEEQKMKWLPKIAKGECIMAIGMTEPDFGSDLAHIQTSAVKDGDNYIINGNKIFMSNGMLADLAIIAARTNREEKGYKGISLILVETNREGFTRRRLRKIGLQSQDTAEYSLVNVVVPQSNLLGEENKGFYYLMNKLQQERLLGAWGAIGQAERSLALALDYVKQRKMFGTTVSKFQNTQFELAKAATEINVGKAFMDQLTVLHMNGEDVGAEVSMAKYYCAELAFRTADRCLQLFGGYGICEEYPIARQFTDTRIQRILAGTSEIQLTIIARSLGL
jgi:Acyl-CoA dehydrogenases